MPPEIAITEKEATDLMEVLFGSHAQDAPSAAPVPVPRVRKSRHFYRCSDCLSIVVTEDKIPETRDETGYNPKLRATCSACGGNVEYMGETRYTVGGQEYALRNVTGYKAICDGKCTNATGPNCDCICGGENHGTGRIVPVYTESGVPHVHVPADAKVKADDYRALVAAFRAKWDAKYRGITEAKRRGEWIDSWSYYMDGQYLIERLGKARALRSHGARNKRLRELITEVAR